LREIIGRTLSKGLASGRAIVTKQPISFLGDVDPESGCIKNKKHELFGVCLKERILCFPHGVGSTVGSYVLYGMKRIYDTAPSGLIFTKIDPVIVVGAIISNIPAVQVEADDFKEIRDGEFIVINALKKRAVITIG